MTASSWHGAGLPAPDSSLIKIGDADCIVVERYDRARVDGTVRRVHQEDTCQALGMDPADRDGRGKYEARGGPTLAQIAGLLDAYSADPVASLTRLLERVTFTIVIADADAHGKNVSLLHPSADHVALAPLYDTVPTALWPGLRRTVAMRVNGRDRLMAITVDDLATEGRRWGMGQHAARATVADVCDRLREAATDLPERSGLDLAGLITGNLLRLAKHRRRATNALTNSPRDEVRRVTGHCITGQERQIMRERRRCDQPVTGLLLAVRRIWPGRQRAAPCGRRSPWYGGYDAPTPAGR